MSQVQHYYCHTCHEYIDAMVETDNGYPGGHHNSTSGGEEDEEWEDVMEECPSCGSPFFELLGSDVAESAGGTNTAAPTSNTVNGNTNHHSTNASVNNMNLPFDLPLQMQNMIQSVMGNIGGLPANVDVRFDIMQLDGDEGNRENGLPAACKDFSADDVLNLLTCYPHGVPRNCGSENNNDDKDDVHNNNSHINELGPDECVGSPVTDSVPNDGVCTVCL
uniref:Uncharacterized protein n=1 Tax=Lygus hesperus TaxID=30085 RepID=A0A0A9VZX2_LYGHE